MIKNICSIKFTLNIYCSMLDSDGILKDTGVIKVGKLTYWQYETLIIRKFDEAIETTKEIFKWKYGQAVIS